jgi:hypothetical protein
MHGRYQTGRGEGVSAILDGMDPGTFSGICAAIGAIVLLAVLIGHDIWKNWDKLSPKGPRL